MKAHQDDQHTGELRETRYYAQCEITDDHAEYRHQGRKRCRAPAAERDHGVREKIDRQGSGYPALNDGL